MPPLILSLKTTDKDFIETIKGIKDDNFKISVYTTDEISKTADIAMYILTIASPVIANLILKLIKKLLKKSITNKPTQKTTINDLDIKIDSSQIFVLINNYINQEKRDQNET